MENIFCVSGSALRLQKLEAAFNEPPYGKGLDCSGYTVHDAAGILLRYLHRLPESIIPVTMYEAFQNPLKPYQGDLSTSPLCDVELIINEYRERITLLLPEARQLLLYLLDILAVFASRSEVNKMTFARLATVFQPSILSPVKAGDDFIENGNSRRLSIDVLSFLMEKKDGFF